MLLEPLQIHDTLEQKIWSDKSLKEEVQEKLMQIANDFFDDLGLDGADVVGVTFTGSLANYNWTKYSDIDLHILADFDKIDENYDLVREYFSAKTSNWNKNHDIFIFGYQVELYVQHIGEEHHSTGIYSVDKNEWIAEPSIEKPEVDKLLIQKKFESFSDMIDRVEDIFDDHDYENAHEFSIKLAKKIRKYRQSGLEDKGEYSTENLVFKLLRNSGNIKTLYSVRNRSYDKMMSLGGDYEKKFKIFINKDEIEDKPGFDKLDEIEKFQRRVRRRHGRAKKWFLGYGKQKAGRAYPGKPSYRRGKSAPAGFGGT